MKAISTFVIAIGVPLAVIFLLVQWMSTPQLMSAARNPSGSKLAGNLTVVVTPRVYLAIVSFTPCDQRLPDCYEPNNTFATSYGPLIHNQTYTATADFHLDQNDFYTTTLNLGTRYTLSLNNLVTGDLDLFLYDTPVYTSPIASSTQSGLAPDTIVYTPTITGKYYALVYVYTSTVTTRYTLRITP